MNICVRVGEINEIEHFPLFSYFRQPLPPLPPVAQLPTMPSQQKSNNEQFATVSTTTQTTCLSTIKPATSVASTTTPTGIVKPTPSIAVTHTHSIEREEKALINLSQRSKPTSPSKRKDIKKHLQHKSKHSALDRIHRWEHKIGLFVEVGGWWFCADIKKINNLYARRERRKMKSSAMIGILNFFQLPSRELGTRAEYFRSLNGCFVKFQRELCLMGLDGFRK